MTKFVTTWLSHVLNKKVRSKTILDLTVNLCNAMNLLYPNAISNITDDPLENSKNFFEGYTNLGFKTTNKFNANNLAKGRLVGLREILESLTSTKQHKWTRKLNFKVEKEQTDHNTQGIVANISGFFVKGFTTFEVTFKSNQYEYQPGTIQLTENHFLFTDYHGCESKHKYQSLTSNRLLQDRSNQKILKLYLPDKTKGPNTKPNEFLLNNSQYADKNKKKIKKIEYYSQEESLFFEEEEEEEELISLIICFKRQTELITFWKLFELFSWYPGKEIESYPINGLILGTEKETEMVSKRCLLNEQCTFNLKLSAINNKNHNNPLECLLRLTKNCFSLMFQIKNKNATKSYSWGNDQNINIKKMKIMN